MNVESINQKSVPPKDEIDLIALVKTIWNGRRTIYISVAIAMVLGLISGFTSEKEFEASTVMLPSENDATAMLGGLGGLAAMAGIDLSKSANDIAPIYYPRIVSSLPFQLELMKTPLNFSGHDKPITLLEYYAEPPKENPFLKYTIGLPGLILSLPFEILKAIQGPAKIIEQGEADKNKILQLTSDEQTMIKYLYYIITLEGGSKDNSITLTARLPEAYPTAQLGQRAQELLQQYITEFRIKKAKANLDFIQERTNETGQKLELAQQKLAAYNDRNKNVSLAVSKLELEKLTREYNLIFGIYSELAKQLEQSKIKVKQDTPVFTILEPISVPGKKSKPKKLIILIVYSFLGGVAGVGTILWRNKWTAIKEKWDAA